MKPRQVLGTNYTERARGVETAKEPQVMNQLTLGSTPILLGTIPLILNV